MKITLELTETEAIYVRDALIDKSITLRTGARDIVIKEDDFLANASVSERRKANYLTLREVARQIAGRLLR